MRVSRLRFVADEFPKAALPLAAQNLFDICLDPQPARLGSGSDFVGYLLR